MPNRIDLKPTESTEHKPIIDDERTTSTNQQDQESATHGWDIKNEKTWPKWLNPEQTKENHLHDNNKPDDNSA